MNAVKVDPKSAEKDRSMLLQKEMISRNYDLLASAHEMGRKVSSTFVPGNLNELLMCFDLVRNLPEVNSLQSAMRKKTGMYIMEAERRAGGRALRCGEWLVRAAVGGWA